MNVASDAFEYRRTKWWCGRCSIWAFGFSVNDSDKYVVVDDSGIDVLPIELNPLGFNWLDEYFIANSCHLFPIFKNLV